jgi:hypothetical protein
MAYQSNKPKDPPLYHSTLAKNGPKLVAIKSSPKWVKQNTLCVIEVIVDGVVHVYFTENRDIASKFQQYVGKSVVLIASGNSKQKTDSMEIQPAGVPASSLPNAPQPAVIVESKPAAFKTVTTQYGSQSIPQSPQKAPESVVAAAKTPEREAKEFLCKATNLMRLCVKKANDIAVEMDLSSEHRQGIASSLFINADRHGFVAAMPINPYKPEQLGFGASKAESLKNPEPNND